MEYRRMTEHFIKEQEHCKHYRELIPVIDDPVKVTDNTKWAVEYLLLHSPDFRNALNYLMYIILKFCIVRSVMSSFESLYSRLCSSTAAKTGDKLSLRCFFQSNTKTTVVKISKWKLIYVNFIKIKCTWHLLCEVRHGGSRVMPLFWNC